VKARRLVVGLVVAGMFTAAPAGAKILKTKRPREYRPLSLNVGSGFEYETDGEETEYGFPFLVEYGITRQLKVSAEPSYHVLKRKTGETVKGAGDLETTLTWEFPIERRYRPGLSLEAGVKWPTAKKGDLGTGKADFTIGAIVSQEFTRVDLDFNAAYTFVGDPPGLQLRDVFEAALAAEWHLSPLFDLEAEVVSGFGAGGRFAGQPGTIGGFANIGGPEQGQSEVDFTLGLAEHLSDRFKLQEGAILKSGGSWQAVLAWEYDFGEGN
jgi:hypothetical protein